MIVAEDRRLPGEESKPLGSIMPMQESTLMSPPPRPARGQSQSESMASRAGNRLSLSLPIQAGDRDSSGPMRHTTVDSDALASQASPLLDVKPNISVNASGDFLVALAAQERRVLELKEELYRAESQLKKLKRQWALHEASRNTSRPGVEIRPVELQPIKSTVSGVDGMTDVKEEAKPMQRNVYIDIDRRKAMLAASAKESRRKVIRGGHTRALSLLSPVQSSYVQNMPASSPFDSNKEHSPAESELPNTQYPTKSSSSKTRHSYQGSTTGGVKQIAEDIRSGLWTFMEDLRQATVGDEAIKGVPSSNTDTALKGSGGKGCKGSSSNADQSLHRSPRLEIAASKARETGQKTSMALTETGEPRQCTEMVAQMPTATGRKPETASSLDDDWSNWESPVSKGESGRWSNSTALSSHDAGSVVSPFYDSKSLQQTIAVSSTPKRDEVAWSALNNFTPSNIKRTASAIMKEWEKSLTPLANDRSGSITSDFPKLAKKANEEESRLLLNNLP